MRAAGMAGPQALARIRIGDAPGAAALAAYLMASTKLNAARAMAPPTPRPNMILLPSTGTAPTRSLKLVLPRRPARRRMPPLPWRRVWPS